MIRKAIPLIEDQQYDYKGRRSHGGKQRPSQEGRRVRRARTHSSKNNYERAIFNNIGVQVGLASKAECKT